MDIGTGLVLAGSAAASKDLVVKLLGPTTDYLGEGMKDFTQKRINNINHIFSIAVNKLGPKIEAEGTVSPSVLKGILTEGSFSDDILVQDYFGGVLASSRIETSKDDRGKYFISLISRLSNYQLRTHYILYHCFKNVLEGKNYNPNKKWIKLREPCEGCKCGIVLEEYVKAMEFGEENIQVLLSNLLSGLNKEGLIGDYDFRLAGESSNSFKLKCEEGEEFMCLKPSYLGIELFLWAYAKNDINIDDFLNTKYNFENHNKISLPLRYRYGECRDFDRNIY